MSERVLSLVRSMLKGNTPAASIKDWQRVVEETGLSCFQHENPIHERAFIYIMNTHDNPDAKTDVQNWLTVLQKDNKS